MDDLGQVEQQPLSQNKRKVEMPTALTAELTRMRRDPAAFSVFSLSKCRFCTDKETQYDLAHVSQPAGAWCATHGWTSFDSASLPPTERLTPSETEDRRLARERKRGPRQ